ncbi:Hypothetical_protein [Hexamita inflata]|uniref:Hypothetical_protein n=1 Tax=Hexamita inflata TaxID=28002 RepID=A0AA86R246_9EUKA|nr:Hypothetical protein HINF_LOCUS56555 [Hexamita inflata]
MNWKKPGGQFLVKSGTRLDLVIPALAKTGTKLENPAPQQPQYKCPYSSCKQIMHDTKGIEQHLQRAMKSTNSLTKEAHTVKDVYTPQFYVLHCNSKVIDDTWLKYHTNTANLPPTRFTPMNTRIPDVIIRGDRQNVRVWK